MTGYYNIGGHLLKAEGDEPESVARIEGFAPFAAADAPASVALRLILAASAAPEVGPRGDAYRFAFEGTDCTFTARGQGEYLFRMTDTEGRALELRCPTGRQQCTIAGLKSPRLLRFALWMAYGLLTAARQTLCLHASAIVWRGKAVVFLGESGTGKSTHTRLWQEHIPGAGLLNDDSPVVRVVDGTPWVYGSPWSGKTPCYRNVRAPLAAVVRLSQAPYNRIRPLNTVEAVCALHPSCPPALARDETLARHICSTMSQVLVSVPVYHLACLPDAEAALLAFRTVFASDPSADACNPETPDR